MPKVVQDIYNVTTNENQTLKSNLTNSS